MPVPGCSRARGGKAASEGVKSMEATVFGYHIFQSRVNIIGKLTLLSGLHIGRGRALEPAASDLPVLTDRFGNPLIPGSSLKGVLRSNVEGWLRAFFPDARWQSVACDRIADQPCVTPGRKRDIVRQHRDNPAEADRLLWEESCWVCRFFGSPWVASKVQIVDLPVEGVWQREWLTVRDGVAIDRDSETAAPKFKYDFEVVPAGTRFHLEIVLENPEPYELGLLMVGRDFLNDGYALLGGGTSRGLGRIQIEVEGIDILTPEKLLERLAPPRAEPSPPGPETLPLPDPAPANPDDPMQVLLACLRALGSADHAELVRALNERGWKKERLQRAYPEEKKINWDKFFAQAVRAGLISVHEGRFMLPGSPPAAAGAHAASPVGSLAADEEEKRRERERLIREWKEVLWRKIQEVLEEKRCSEPSTTKPESSTGSNP